jgi:hypothetical protein
MTISLSDRAICAAEDVERLVPGFEFDAPTEEIIIDLINAESETLNSKREFTPIEAGSATRLFDISRYAARTRTVRIGDSAGITTVEVQRLDGTVLETVDPANRVSLPRVRQPWQPVEELWFPLADVANPALTFGAGRIVAVTGTWGFPLVPDHLRVACAKLVLSRYLVEYPNTQLAEGAADLNTSSMFASASDVVRRLSNPEFA